ncbi:MAG: hypothetical protein SF052_05665 [Bacteroidia bacterium]|nr:hypothetical protein [Bacteroidia bacterium]
MNEDVSEIVLDSIRNDMAVIGKSLHILAQRVIEEEISDYPIFVASQEYLDIGKPIFDRDVVHVNWFFNISFLEDFLRKGLINSDKTHQFKRTFGDPLKKACVFVITEESGQFVFVPYDPDAEE